MGTWGYRITQDDYVADVIDDFKNHLKQSQNLELTSQYIIEQYSQDLEDPDDGPLFWLGLAEVQWNYGFSQNQVLAKIKKDFEDGNGLARWEEQGSSSLEKRKSELQKFIEKIKNHNPKPKKLPKVIIRKPIYESGDCLAIKLKNCMFTAAIVLQSNHSDPELGSNLIGVLDYLSEDEPTPEIFEKRKWLIKNFGNWENKLELSWYGALHYQNTKRRIKVVCNTKIRKKDPKQSNSYAMWDPIGESVILQRDWMKEHQGEKGGFFKWLFN